MSMELEKRHQLDILAEQVSGYFSVPSEAELAYTDLLFSVCEQFGIYVLQRTPERSLLCGKNHTRHMGAST